MLLADKDQYAGRQRQDCHHDARQRKVKECRDSDKNQINRKKEHSEVFRDVHGFVLRQGHDVCTPKITRCKIIYGSWLTTLTAGYHFKVRLHSEPRVPLVLFVGGSPIPVQKSNALLVSI